MGKGRRHTRGHIPQHTPGRAPEPAPAQTLAQNAVESRVQTPARAAGQTPAQVADAVARDYYGVTDAASRVRVVAGVLAGAVEAAVLVPLFFYLCFGEVGGLGWGVTVFLVAWFLLSAVGLVFAAKPEYHTAVAPREGHLGWADRIGGFWLVACAFGPLFGWGVTSAAVLTPGNWRWLYGTRAVLAIALPLVTALPLLRYARGKAALVSLPLLVVVTLLPVSSAFRVAQDLLDGPVVRPPRMGSGGHPELLLRHTGQSLRESDGPGTTPAKPSRRPPATRPQTAPGRSTTGAWPAG